MRLDKLVELSRHGGRADDAVLEPPHRPDQAQPGRLHAVAARALRLPPAKRRAFETFAENFLADLEMRDDNSSLIIATQAT